MKWILFGSLIVLIMLAGCQSQPGTSVVHEPRVPPRSMQWPLPPDASPELKQLLVGTLEQTKVTTGYDPSYVRITYPGGDVPAETGVCSDVVVRAFRKAGVDLQKEVHEDMTAAWSVYPRKWDNTRPDSNIDHRRVLNLMTFFERKGKSLSATPNRGDYLPGDIVTWDLGGGVPHIGIVSNLALESSSGDAKHFLIIHNIGAGAKGEDVLFNWKVTGHYRYF